MENVIRKLRGALTQAEFAKKIGISQQAVAKYEQGRTPKIDILEKVAAATGHRIVITIEKIEENEADH